MVQVYGSQNELILSCFMLNEVRSGSSERPRTKRQDSSDAIFATPKIMSVAGQQNPTCGTMAFFDAIRGMGNLHKINTLHQPWAFGTMVANRFGVVESPSRPHCIQFSLSLL
jgi:hypothetical protein